MLSRRSAPVALCWSALDLAWDASAAGVATIYDRGAQQFHVLLHEESVNQGGSRLLWLEVLPDRLTLTMQGDGQSHFRHLLRPGATGSSHFWVGEQRLDVANFTRSLLIDYPSPARRLPCRVEVVYELWLAHQRLGVYQLDARIACD
ncbi:MAG: hypothetical protein Q6J68_03890 [Thermostichales cyanobacterium SZTDM-1c_bins_54]